MPSNKRTTKMKQLAKEDQLIRDSLGLLSLIASESMITRKELYEWCVRSPAQVDKELRWAVKEKLLFVGAGRVNLSADGRARVVLNFIAVQGGATVANIERMFKFPRVGIVQMFGEMRDAGLLRLDGALNFEPPLYVATKEGLALVKRGDLPEVRLAPRDEGHLRACLDDVISLAEEYGPRGQHGLHWEWWGERLLARENRGKSEENRFASPPYYEGEDGEKRSYKRPDLLLVRRFRDSDRLEVRAIEVELTAKAEATLDAVLWAYFCCETIDAVDYHVSSLVKRDLEKACARLEARIAAEIEKGNLEPGRTSNINVIPLPSAFVPAERRASHYKPVELPGSVKRFQEVSRTKRWEAGLRLSTLKVVQWVTLSGIVTPDAVEVWLRLRDKYPAEELLTLAHGAEWLYYSDISRDEGPMFFATKAGRLKVGLDLPELEIDYNLASHYMRIDELCNCSRVAAHLSVELPSWEIKSRWEMRADRLWIGDKSLLAVAATGQGLGYHRYPDLLMRPPAGLKELLRAVIILPSWMQASKVYPIIKTYLEDDGIGYLYVYVGDPDVLEAAEDAVEKLHAKNEVDVRELPLSPARKPIEDEGALKGCSLPSQTRTARANT